MNVFLLINNTELLIFKRRFYLDPRTEFEFLDALRERCNDHPNRSRHKRVEMTRSRLFFEFSLLDWPIFKRYLGPLGQRYRPEEDGRLRERDKIWSDPCGNTRQVDERSFFLFVKPGRGALPVEHLW
jgi:hypothetical protein